MSRRRIFHHCPDPWVRRKKIMMGTGQISFSTIALAFLTCLSAGWRARCPHSGLRRQLATRPVFEKNDSRESDHQDYLPFLHPHQPEYLPSLRSALGKVPVPVPDRPDPISKNFARGVVPPPPRVIVSMLYRSSLISAFLAELTFAVKVWVGA